ncbi:dTDP-4-dehydrorhamnose 3,5-epimerase family protein [Microcella alkaliphila]|uniref:Putative dTDP-4-dehydrorhamnose 3,5-epimerase n=1 Tax=Microcella alkaliphila TaxID=279828 RepID=A0A0U5BBL4_9MICO|nr:putative dTDP-4-dehydrorhamnose 3,5-epimerase [Microcella alkaliphila]
MVNVDALAIADSFLIESPMFEDERGSFSETFLTDVLQDSAGHRFTPRQANTSVSHRGVLRGVHFADVPTGQAKYVSVARGAIIDFIVDIRVGSPTYGQWDSVVLQADKRRSVYLAEGRGHAFLELEDNSTVTYLVSGVYRPAHEHGISPLDAELALVIPDAVGAPLLSPKDAAAPTLRKAQEQGLLPRWDECVAWYRREGGDR